MTIAPPLTTRVVRAVGSDRIHVVDAPAALLGRYRMFGADFTGISTPIITRCGAKLGGGAAVCMEPGTRVRCSRCHRLTGIAAAAQDNAHASILTEGAR